MPEEIVESSVQTRKTAQDRYDSLKSERDTYLDRARNCSRLTIPALIPEEGDHSSAELYQPFQSIGSRGVNHLAAKLMLALFPPGQPFFELTMEEYVLESLREEVGGAEGFAKAKNEFEEALGRVERTVMTRLEHTGARTSLNEVLKHLIVGGNALVYVQDDTSLKVYPLSKFVVKRDKSDNVIEIIVKDSVARTALPDEIRAMLKESEGDQAGDLSKMDDDHENNIDIYTRVRWDDKKWAVYQEVAGKVVPDSDGEYPEDKSPWLPLRLTKVDGEDYGRSFVEEYLGDLRSAEGLNEAVLKVSAAAAKILIFVNDNGLVNTQTVRDAESGSVLPGEADDVTILQLEKFPDFRVANEVLERVEGRLEQAFLLFSAVQRDAERVTAQEIRAVVNELEQGLGGVYSVLAQELQIPLVRRVMLQMEKADDLPELPEGAVSPEIITGVDALGRTSDLRKYDLFLAGVQEAFGPEVVAQYVDPRVYMQMRANKLGIGVDGLVRSEEKVQQMREQAMQARVAEKVAPEAAKQQQQNNEGEQ